MNSSPPDDNASGVAAGRGDNAPLKLEQFLPYRLNVVASLVSQALSRIYADRYGIGVPEWRVLVTLGQYGMMTGKAIGQHSHMHKTKVSRAVALLESRKLVMRRANRADLREAFLALSRTATLASGVEALTIQISDLAPTAAVQLDLFAPAVGQAPQLKGALDRLRMRYASSFVQARLADPTAQLPEQRVCFAPWDSV